MRKKDKHPQTQNVPELPRVEVDRPSSGPPQNFSKVRDDRAYEFAKLDKRDLERMNRLAPQGKVVANILNPDNIEKRMTEQEVYNAMEAGLERLKTKQHFWRIFQYYRSSLINYGYFRIV